MEFEKLVTAALKPKGLIARPNQLIRLDGIIGRRDPLTELQRKMITAIISLRHKTEQFESQRTTYKMGIDEFLNICDIHQEDIYSYLTNEIEKVLKKGVSLYDEINKKLTHTLWFQAIEYDDKEITFQFAEKMLPLIIKFAPNDTEYELAKRLQYKGKHTLAVFDIIWPWRSRGLTELSIPELMQQLSLEHTRYSYGQLKLRVLEPSLEEIYAWDDAIFVRFGPTFSGRRVEGVWFEVTVGEKARKLRKKEPEFKFLLPEEKPTKAN
ncbi:plasmid replication initiation protein [Sporomusaceae bacterium BoRhaA]|uniref:replication initiation protein n=1 Tax=Pelorhabdus rhamnosifermentans TaxID=2772457 RepID=UPI001C063FC7|nr:replication initiation protein [Pelorhabdus rhamnosifermentans]MBU2702341.1 plasmid replication initiation protein [Pelorhabdus rhamnosifermentans]